MLNSLLLIIIIVLLYLNIIGSLTIVERKTIGMGQLRLSIEKSCFFGVYGFYLDFIKVIIKGFYSCTYKKNLIPVLLLIFIIFINLTVFIIILLSFKIEGFRVSILILIIVSEIFTILLKIILLNTSFIKFVKYTLYRVKFIYIFLEGVTTFTIMVNLVIITTLNVKGCDIFGFGNMILLIIFLMILLFIVIIKLSRTPFDYFECESETSGGGVIEFFGFSFILWSFLEYSLILNNLLFLVYIINLYLNPSIFILTLVLLKLIILIFIIRGVFVRIKLFSISYFILYLYMVVLLLFFFLNWI